MDSSRKISSRCSRGKSEKQGRKKPKKMSQSMQNVMRISQRDGEAMKTLKKAMQYQMSVMEASPDLSTFSRASSSGSPSMFDVNAGPVSTDFRKYHAQRQIALLERESKRLDCKLKASEEALRRAQSAEIPSSQCQSEFAMLFSQTDAGARGKGSYVNIQDERICPYCKIAADFIEREGEIRCRKCGWNREYMECTMNSLAQGETRDFRAGSYKRINHFLDYLQHLQAKEETIPPETLVQELKNHIINELHLSLESCPRFVLDRIVEYVKKNKFQRRYTVRSVQLYHYVFQSTSEKLLHSDIRNLKSKFKMLLALYYKYVPTSRKNFLSYPFCAFCLIRLIHPKHRLLEFVQMLKNLPKLQPQAEIVQKIFVTLGWEFAPIPWTHIRETRERASYSAICEKKNA